MRPRSTSFLGRPCRSCSAGRLLSWAGAGQGVVGSMAPGPMPPSTAPTPASVCAPLPSPQGPDGGASVSVDIWSVGCIMAEMITGKTLFKGSDRILHLEPGAGEACPTPAGSRPGTLPRLGG